MQLSIKKSQRILAFALIVAVLGGLVGIQAAVSPALAEGPNGEEPVLTVLVIPEGDAVGMASIGAPPVFEVGDTFRVSIVALGVADPGIFGSQFEITFDPAHLAAVEGSLASGTALEPVVTALANLDNTAGLVRYAASRQGDVDNVPGNVVLATLRFEAVGATEPPEGQTTVLHLQNVKLGAKGGIEVPVGGLVDLEVIIVEPDGGEPGAGDIAGNVQVEGRAADNQAGHTVTAVGDVTGALAAVTGSNGDFVISDAPADTYTMTADHPGFLAASCADVVHTGDALTTLADVTLLAGDLVDLGVIDISDAVAIGAVFGSTTPGEVADLNADGVVDILDLVLMAVNFGQTSAGNPWVCQSSPEL
jgi:adhesin HecA-like repeat protein